MKKIANIVLNDFVNDSRVLKTSKSLAALGLSVTIVAMHNKGLSERDEFEGIKLHRIRLITRSRLKWKPLKIFIYLEFLIKAVLYYRKYDVVHCNDLYALPVGSLIKSLGANKRVFYDCHEYETQTNGIGKVEKFIKGWLERKLIYHADAVITVSNSIANEYVKLYGISKPRLLLNCPVYKKQPKKNLFRETLSIRDNQTIFLYQGALMKGRGIELLLKAFSELKSDKIVLVCMGYGPLEACIQNKANKFSNIFFHPAVCPDVLLNYTSSADYGLSFIEDSCLSYRYCLPNKIFEYLMAGLPVLTSNLHEQKRFVENEGVGVVAKDNSIKGLQNAIKVSLNKNHKAIQKNVFEARKKYCWEQVESVLKDIYSGIE